MGQESSSDEIDCSLGRRTSHTSIKQDSVSNDTANPSLFLPQKRKRKKKGDWQKAKIVSEGICTASSEQQALWLWESYASSTGSSSLEKAGLEGKRISKG